MNFDFRSEGLKHRFRMSQNQLIIECYDFDGYHIGDIKIIVNEKEKARLIGVLNE